MIEHAGLVAYLWFTMGNLGTLWNIGSLILLVVVISWYIFYILSTEGILWMSIDINEASKSSFLKEELTNAVKNKTKLFFLTKILVFMLIINTFIPSRNQMLIIFSAKPLIKSGVNISNNIIDSNTTKSIGIILNNSLKYLEKKSNDLNK